MDGLPAAAQQNVTVRAGEHQDYGRIVFDWGKEVGFETSSSGLTATSWAASVGTAPR